MTLGLEEVAKSVAPAPGFEPVYFFKHWDDTLGTNIYSARVGSEPSPGSSESATRYLHPYGHQHETHKQLA